MDNNKRGRDPVYPESLKIAVAREYLTGNDGYGKLARKYELRDARVVRGFVDWHRRRYPDPENPGSQVQVDPAPRGINEREWQRQLQEANLKIAGLQMLIEVAQKELGIDIVKKPGTKQSLK